MFGKVIVRGFITTSIVSCAVVAQAMIIDLVPVGYPGNANDTTGYGSVDAVYQIGKYEVTNAQWREFLNAKANLGDPYGLYDDDMAGTYGGIVRGGSGTAGDPYVYAAKDGNSNWDNRPVNYVSFWDAARFVNWLHNGQGDGDTESGAYSNIGNQSMFARQPGAKYFIPTEDEWYKAAYHKNDGVTGNYFLQATASDSTPSNDLLDPDGGNNANFYQSGGYTIDSPYYTTLVGDFENSASPYGTFDQCGNLWEWNENVVSGSSRRLRGGCWIGNSYDIRASTGYKSDSPEDCMSTYGFRVASVPEPGGLVMLAGIAWTALLYYWRKRA